MHGFSLPERTAIETRLNTLQRQLLEHGFNAGFNRYDFLINSKALEQIYGKKKSKKINLSEVNAIQLEDLYFVFHVYLIYVPIYLLIFMVELLHLKWCKSKKRLFPRRKKGETMHRQRTERLRLRKMY